ncbi:MAG: ATP-dependent DNA helicase RecG [Flavobacteriia bacterium]|nr:ATP-dependent DNA helicase RecG [Flavobacteriia bacterium]
MSELLQTPIEFLKGVGPQRAQLLQKELGIFNYGDLLHTYPYRYLDRSIYHKCKDLPYVDSYVQLVGTIDNIKEIGTARFKRLSARFSDDSGTIELIWFQGGQWIKQMLVAGLPYQAFGKAKLTNGIWAMPHPELTPIKDVFKKAGFQPFYSSTEKLNHKGLNTKGIEKLVQNLFVQHSIQAKEYLPENLIKEHQLISRTAALKQIHLPVSEIEIQQAKLRLKFEELFFLQLEMLIRKGTRVQATKGHIFEQSGELLKEFYTHHLPFELTNAQKRVIKEIRKDFLTGRHMNRLLQGDVGSGKTLVALIAMLIANGNGYQACIMAPTEILANQHFETIRELLKGVSIRIALLTGSTKKSERTPLFASLQNGEINLLIGTHALLEDPVQFNNLGFVVIDEQHRFGVAQRGKMWKKNSIPPHVLVMTATPIPRTLAMTFYGDLDVSVIDELPPGRKPISTIHRFESHRLALFGFMRKEIALGRQIYIVYPLIKESEKLDFNNLMDGFEAISRSFPIPDYQVSIVHGKMKPEAKDYEMQRFIKGETHIMVATTVIEVGVNVPNASVMIIESAERFGLAQLHQLRGRVGRGAEKSYCILMTGNELSREAKKRMGTMVATTDGFEIAEVDLQLRGPGDLMGTQQSGILELKIADLAKDGDLINSARDSAIELIEKDPNLLHEENTCLREKMISLLRERPNWGKIG